jgi:hypothetical protein
MPANSGPKPIAGATEARMIDGNYISEVVLVLVGTSAGVFGLLLVRRLVGARYLGAHHDVASALLSVVGTLYAVLLGLVVVDAMENFEEARQATLQEENALVNLVLLAGRLPAAKRDEVRRLAVDYGRNVVEREWPMMDHAHTDPQTHRAGLKLIRAALDFEPRSESEKAIYPQLVQSATDLWDARHIRAVVCTEGIPTMVWVVLVAGGIVTVAFTYFFVVERLHLQVIMTALVSLSISLNVVLVMMFGHPYSGGVKVAAPESFRVPADLLEDGAAT